MPRSSSAPRVAAHRAEMRRRGMRLLQMWVPDTGAPGFAEEARRQSRLVDRSPDFDELMDFIERNSAWPDTDDDVPRYDEAG